MEDRKKIEDLEHKLLEEKMLSGFELLKKTINDGFDMIKIENEAQNKISTIQRKEILKRQDLTNGRVTALEATTSITKFMRENKKIAILVFYALYNILEVTTIENAQKLIQWIRLLI